MRPTGKIRDLGKNKHMNKYYKNVYLNLHFFWK